MQNEGAPRSGASRLLSEGLLDGAVSPSSSPPSSCDRGVKYIEHRVSKMDTLAGVAIKYGVEVADIKRINGLVTDRQMFAHKTLRIPLPGRHSPSPIHLNGAANNSNREHTPVRQPHMESPDSLQSLKLKPSQRKISPAMVSLQGYYGLKPPKKGPAVEETEMTVYKISGALYFEDEPPKTSRASDPRYPDHHHRRSASLTNGFPNENPELAAVSSSLADGSDERSKSEKSVRRRQKADADPPLHALDLLMDSGGLTGRIGKGLAPRPKSGSPLDTDVVQQNAISTGDTCIGNGFFAVRKSLSTTNLQESDSGSSRPTSKWILKSDAITRPIFGGLPKPIAAWIKAALD